MIVQCGGENYPIRLKDQTEWWEHAMSDVVFTRHNI